MGWRLKSARRLKVVGECADTGDCEVYGKVHVTTFDLREVNLGSFSSSSCSYLLLDSSTSPGRHLVVRMTTTGDVIESVDVRASLDGGQVNGGVVITRRQVEVRVFGQNEDPICLIWSKV